MIKLKGANQKMLVTHINEIEDTLLQISRIPANAGHTYIVALLGKHLLKSFYKII